MGFIQTELGDGDDGRGNADRGSYPTEKWSEEELIKLYLDTDAREIDLRKVLDYLMDRPDQPVSGKELATYLGVTGEQFRGVMGGPASRVLDEYKHRPPFKVAYDPQSNLHSPAPRSGNPTECPLGAAGPKTR